MAKRRADGEGNVRQKRPNLWEARIVAGHKKRWFTHIQICEWQNSKRSL